MFGARAYNGRPEKLHYPGHVQRYFYGELLSNCKQLEGLGWGGVIMLEILLASYYLHTSGSPRGCVGGPGTLRR